MQMKIISPKDKYKDELTYQNLINYITRPDKCPTGFIITKNININSIADDMAKLEEKFNKKKDSTKVRHMVITFDEQDEVITIEAAQIAKRASDFYADKYQVVAAVHEDTDNLHIHMVMNTTNIHDGKKYTGRKKDYYDFLNHMKSIARRYGMKFRIVK